MQPFDPPIYLDHAASALPHPLAVQEMLPYLDGSSANPSSQHSYGRRARAALDTARDRVAAFIGAKSSDICFTSGGTESCNLAIAGAASLSNRRVIVISSVEHHCVLHAAQELVRHGFELRTIPVNAQGELDLDAAASLIDESVSLVSVMMVNNETGAIHQIKKIAVLARAAGALFHTDAVQAVELQTINVESLEIYLLSLSGHKFGGVPGSGEFVP